MSSKDSPDHKKKHEHRKKNTTLPPDVLPDGGLNSRIHGVPGSTPGCTAGAYAKSFDPTDLPEVSVKSCFPDHYANAKKWLTEVHPKSLQMLLTAYGPPPTIADIVNKWMIRRVGRKCIEGTEEGRKDLEAFCVDALKRLRRIPTCSMKLYRAVPWSAMGKLAPGLSEFEEETNIVWPTFTSLTKSESRARELFKTEGGILFVVETDQARDVTDVASVHQEDGEFMLEPNSCFTITANKQEEKVFVVEMKQNFPSPRPIMKEIEEHKHHRHGSIRIDPSEPSSQLAECVTPTKGEGTTTIVTPVIRRTPSATTTPLGRNSSLSCLSDSSGSPGSPRFARSSSRLAFPQSPSKATPKPKHRVQVASFSNSMTMWSAARGYIKVLSTNGRGKVVKSYVPRWASGEPKEEEKKEEKKEDKKESEEKKEEEVKEKKEKKEKKDKKDKKDKKKKKEKGGEGVVTPLSLDLEKKSGSDDGSTPPVSPTTPGYGTLELYPQSAPTYIIDDRTVDCKLLVELFYILLVELQPVLCH